MSAGPGALLGETGASADDERDAILNPIDIILHGCRSAGRADRWNRGPSNGAGGSGRGVLVAAGLNVANRATPAQRMEVIPDLSKPKLNGVK